MAETQRSQRGLKNDDGQYLSPNGEVMDPPVIPEFEQRLADAHSRADQGDIDALTAEYEKARDDRVKTLHDRAREDDK